MWTLVVFFTSFTKEGKGNTGNCHMELRRQGNKLTNFMFIQHPSIVLIPTPFLWLDFAVLGISAATISTQQFNTLAGSATWANRTFDSLPSIVDSTIFARRPTSSLHTVRTTCGSYAWRRRHQGLQPDFVFCDVNRMSLYLQCGSFIVSLFASPRLLSPILMWRVRGVPDVSGRRDAPCLPPVCLALGGVLRTESIFKRAASFWFATDRRLALPTFFVF